MDKNNQLVKVCQAYINDHHLTNEHIAICLSGGVDSMAIYHILKATNLNLTVITVNHNLRPESPKEIEWLKSRIPNLIVMEWVHQSEITSNIEEKARDARYEMIINKCKELNIKNAFIGHHANDQIETFFLNLTRGSGVDGLSCMQCAIKKNGITFHRPLLNTLKKEIYQFAKEQGIEWLEDSSNTEMRFTRNKIRKMINKILGEELAEHRILQTVAHMQDNREAVDYIVQEKLTNITDNGAGFCKITRRAFIEIPNYLRCKIMFHIIANLVKDKTKPRKSKVIDMINNITDHQSGKRSIRGITISWNHDTIYMTTEKK